MKGGMLGVEHFNCMKKENAKGEMRAGERKLSSVRITIILPVYSRTVCYF